MSFWYLQFSPKKWTKIFQFITSSRIVLVHFSGGLKTLKRHFEINWPLVIVSSYAHFVSNNIFCVMQELFRYNFRILMIFTHGLISFFFCRIQRRHCLYAVQTVFAINWTPTVVLGWKNSADVPKAWIHVQLQHTSEMVIQSQTETGNTRWVFRQLK